MADDRLDIAEHTVRRLIEAQFPAFADLPLARVQPGGWDNQTFRLGDTLAVRLPRAERYAPQIEREATAFAALAGRLSIAIPARVATGTAGAGFPFAWAINRWIAGLPAGQTRVAPGFTAQCGHFLKHLHGLDAAMALPPGAGNFHRGGALSHYADEVDRALSRLDDWTLRQGLARAWDRAVGTGQPAQACWLHGDFFPWNLLVDAGGNLSAVIDWGLVAIGDPACDYAIGWTCLPPEQREKLRRASDVDDMAWDRARGWSLWKAVTLATGVNAGTPEDVAGSRTVLERIAADLV